MSQDPEEAGIDWGYTGYGTGDPNAKGFLSKLGKWMPYIVGGIFTAGTLQSMGLLPGMSASEASAADAAISGGAAGGVGPAGGIPIAYASGATIPNAGALGTTVAGAGGAAGALGHLTVNGTTVPLGGVGANAAADAAKNAAGGAGSSLAHRLTSPDSIATLIGSIPSILAAANGTNSANDPMKNPQVQELLNMAVTRQQRVDPLHQAVTQLAMSMMPTAVQK